MIGVRQLLEYFSGRKLRLRAGQLAQLVGNPHVTVYPRPMEFDAGSSRRVLVLTPHADDESFGAGGTIARHVAHGDAVRVQLYSDNTASIVNPRQGKADVVALREAEFAAAMETLGVRDWEAFRIGNSDFERGVYPPLAFIHLIENQPDVLYLPSLFDNHHDHRVLNVWLLRTLREHAAVRPLIRGYEVWSPLPATAVSDISVQMECKRAAMRCYESQLAVIDYAFHIEGLNAYRAMTFGEKSVRHAEAFLELPADAYLELGNSLLLS